MKSLGVQTLLLWTVLLPVACSGQILNCKISSVPIGGVKFRAESYADPVKAWER